MTQQVNPNIITGSTPNGSADGVINIDWRGTYPLDATVLNAAQQVFLNGGQQTICYQVAGIAGGTVLTPEYTVDNGASWHVDAIATAGAKAATLTATGVAFAGVSGYTGHRLRVSTVGTGTVTVFYSATTGSSPHLSPLSP